LSRCHTQAFPLVRSHFLDAETRTTGKPAGTWLTFRPLPHALSKSIQWRRSSVSSRLAGGVDEGKHGPADRVRQVRSDIHGEDEVWVGLRGFGQGVAGARRIGGSLGL
jgi:hypothetical protein